MLHLSLVGGSKPQPWFPHLKFSALNAIYFSTDVCRHLFEFFDFNQTYSPNMTSVQTRVRIHTLRNLPNASLFSQLSQLSCFTFTTSKALSLLR